MKISEIMTANPETAQVTDPIVDVASTMKDLNVGFMPILDGDRLVGVVTDRDIVVRGVAENIDFDDSSISDIMTDSPQTLSPDADINEAADIMETNKIRRLPILDDNGMLVGIITLGDIAVRTKNLEKSGEILEEVSEPSKPERAA